MYKDYFHFTAMPFSIAPDPRFLYMSSRHREALAHLLFGMQGEGGIVLLTGEVGTGKTTLCRCVLEQIDAQSDVAFILNPKMSAEELLAAICDEFHIEMPASAASVKVLVDAINAHLLRANAEGRRAVLIIDEAQNLHPDVLEQLRLLTNLETNTRKLLQIILIGQPELQDMLRRPELRQVAQRVVARYHLTHLTRLEVADYVSHRLRIAGAQLPLIPYALVGSLYRLTGGVPRLINLVCDRALLGAYTQGKMQVTRKILRKAAREVSGMSAPRRLWHRMGWRLGLLAALCGGVAIGAGYVLVQTQPSAVPGAKRPAAAIAPAIPLRSPVFIGSGRRVLGCPPRTRRQYPAPTSHRWRICAGRMGRRRARVAKSWPFRIYSSCMALPTNAAAWVPPVKPQKASICTAWPAGVVYPTCVHINQPAVLLMDGDGKDQKYHAVITSISDKTANFVVAGAPRRVRVGRRRPAVVGQLRDAVECATRRPEHAGRGQSRPGGIVAAAGLGPSAGWRREWPGLVRP